MPYTLNPQPYTLQQVVEDKPVALRVSPKRPAGTSKRPGSLVIGTDRTSDKESRTRDSSPMHARTDGRRSAPTSPKAPPYVDRFKDKVRVSLAASLSLTQSDTLSDTF